MERMNKEELIREYKYLQENNLSMQEEMARTWKKLDDLQQIEQEHQKINGELREENKGLKGRIEYLERSCERKDESNIELYSENVDLASAIDEIKKYIDEYLLNERLVTYRDFRNGLLKIIEKVEK